MCKIFIKSLILVIVSPGQLKKESEKKLSKIQKFKKLSLFLISRGFLPDLKMNDDIDVSLFTNFIFESENSSRY